MTCHVTLQWCVEVMLCLTVVSKLAEEELEFSETSSSEQSESEGVTSDEENCDVIPPKTSQTNEVMSYPMHNVACRTAKVDQIITIWTATTGSV